MRSPRGGAGSLLAVLALAVSLPARTSVRPGPSQGAPQAPRFAARVEVAVPGKPTGVLGADLDGDGRSELACATQDGELLVLDAMTHALGVSSPKDWRVTAGGYPLGPSLLRWQVPSFGPHGPGPGSQGQLALVSRKTRGIVLPTAMGREEIQLAFLPTALACSTSSARLSDACAVFGEGEVFALRRGDGELRGGRLPEGANDVVTAAHFLAEGSGVVIGLQESQRLVRVEFDAQGEIASTAASAPLGGIPRTFAELDLDGDGDLELAVAGGDHSLWVYGWESSWTASAGWSESEPPLDWWVEAIPLDLEAGDLDHDAKDELVVLCYYDSSVQVLDDFKREGPAKVVEHEVGHTPWDTTLADFDGDGWLDLAIANRDAFRVGLMRGGADGFEDTLLVDAGRAPRSIVTGDLDGDGYPELVVLGAIEHELIRFANHEGALVRAESLDGQGAADSLAIADVDGDGALDLGWIAESARGCTLVVAFGDGKGGLGSRESVPPLALGPAPGDLLLADLDHDGRIEALASDPGGGRLLLFGRGGAGEPFFVERAQATIPSRPRSLALLDGKGEAAATIAVGLEGPGERVGALVLAWEGAALVERAFFPTSKGAIGVAAGDLDGDGREDLVVLATGGTDVNPGRAHPFLNRGRDPWLPLPPLDTSNAPFAAALADLDGDSRADLVVSAQHSNHLNVWLARRAEDGSSGWLRMADLGVGRGPLDLALADLDRDGRVDVLCAAHYFSAVSVVYNRAPEKGR